MTTLTNEDVTKLAFIKKVDADGNVKLVACPSDFKVGTNKNTKDLTVMGSITAVSGGASLSGVSSISVKNDSPYGAASGGTSGNTRFNNLALNIRNSSVTEGSFTGISMTCTSEVDSNSMGAAIIAERDDSNASTPAGYKTNLHLCTNRNSDNMCIPRMTITHSGTVGIGTMDPMASLASQLDGDEPNGALHIFGEGYPQLLVHGEDHGIAYISGAAGNECSLRFRTADSLWITGMDDSPNIFDDGYSVKSTNGQDPEFYIHTDGKIGIGVDAVPDTKLHVKSGTAPQLKVDSDTNTSIEINGAAGYEKSILFQNSDSTIWVAGVDNLPNIFDDGFSIKQTENGNPEFYIHTDGKIGIARAGLAAVPSYSVDIQAADGSTEVLRVYNTSTGTDVDVARFQVGRTGNPPTGCAYIEFRDGDGDRNGRLRADGSGGVELVDAFTGQHPSPVVSSSASPQPGMIVVSTGEAWAKSETIISTGIPRTKLCDSSSARTNWGVITEVNVENLYAGILKAFPMSAEDVLCRIANVGEGQVLVCNIDGELYNGDLVITSEISGVGKRQSDDIIRSSTVAKVTESVDWDTITETVIFNNNTYKRCLVACLYY